MVAGLSLVARAALSARAVGAERIVVVVRPEDEAGVREALSGDPRLDGAKVMAATSWSPEAIEAELDGLGAEDEVVVALGDRVWSTGAMRAITAPLDEGVELVTLGGAGDPASGMFLLRGAMLSSERLVDAMAGEGDMVRRGTRLAWCAVRGEEDVHAAESILLASLVKPTDGVISRHLNRKISMFFSRRLARHDVSPNHVTLVVFLIGVASGPLAYRGDYASTVAAGFCYWFSAVLDGTDGELSRLKYMGSPLGAWLDTITDDAVCLSFISGVYLALARDGQGLPWNWIGLVGTGFFLATVLPRYHLMARASGSGDYQKMAAEVRPEAGGLLSRIALRLRDIVFRTDFLPFYAFMTTIFGVVPAFALPFAVGAVASSVDTLMSFLTYRRAARGSAP